jgi:ubiquinone/menaquinone biosynthesis C-methylase UbiE
MNFKDHFSARAELYAKYRPHYPAELFEWIASLVSKHDVVWDCAAGSGQASAGLAEHFERVIATDASEKQIAMAEPHERIEFRVAKSDASGLPDQSVNMITVAQAIHWLEHDSFYREARRVMRPDAAIVIWGYGDPVIDDPALDRIVHDYNRGTIEKYWMPERDLILLGLRTIPFPFREIESPAFKMKHEWTLEQLAGYMRTWSATAKYAEAINGDPVATVENELATLWGADTHTITWPIHIRAGYCFVDAADSGNRTNLA